MNTSARITRTFRVQNNEIANLENTLEYLRDKKKSLDINELTQESYKKLIDSLPNFVRKRDSLLKELENLAAMKYEESHHSDMTANLCLYLINQQKCTEYLNETLEKQYIDSKYSKERFLFAELAMDDSLPQNLEEMKPKYESLKKELIKIDDDLKTKTKALLNVKEELENMRKENRDSEKSVPETTRIMIATVEELDRQLEQNEKKLQKKQHEIDEKKAKYDKRVNLIDDIVRTLSESNKQVKNDTKLYKVQNELKLILGNINSENRSIKFIKARINILLNAIRNEDIISNTTTKIPQQQIIPQQQNVLVNTPNQSQQASSKKTTTPFFARCTPQSGAFTTPNHKEPGSILAQLKERMGQIPLMTPQVNNNTSRNCTPVSLKDRLENYKSANETLNARRNEQKLTLEEMRLRYEELSKKIAKKPVLTSPPPVKSSE
ncbi:hypothetical protein TRFO_05277 [Tritrichomonas foetus]|uniref:Uncharacterized protein n=1 Tax=Tritrichomonas foetus TaxID=1144522 RepID=A0A1J4K873_9EUKA|nr:hypothetical protein TRFO_05277 [Tritrichomonas foetus]|eukprot:OHT07080.1 hypothetical protein TRFO_05277 [Tritrichomonas foetus]